MAQLITYRVRLRIALFCVISLVLGCSSDTSQSTATQRSIALANFDDGVEVSLIYGAFRNLNSSPIIARAATPDLAITVRSGPLPDDARAFEIQNVSPNASLKITDVITLNSENEDGCPFGVSELLSCEPARAALGATCGDNSDCPTGTQCLSAQCAPTAAFSDCTLPDFSHDETNPTTLYFNYKILACRSLRFTVEEEEKKSTVRVAIVGSVDSLDTLKDFPKLVEDQGIDFFVFLGNVSPDFSTDALDSLSKAIKALPIPAIVIAGDDEAVIENGSPFLRRFGPHEHVFAHKKVKFFSFYSATGSLGEVGIERLDSLLARARRGAEEQPFVVFTHTPPLDIESGRDEGFRNPVEGARVHAILNRYNVNMLFAGNTIRSGSEMLGDLEVVLTGDSDTASINVRNVTILDVDADGKLTYESVEF